jgi:hypothetical protein
VGDGTQAKRRKGERTAGRERESSQAKRKEEEREGGNSGGGRVVGEKCERGGCVVLQSGAADKECNGRTDWSAATAPAGIRIHSSAAQEFKRDVMVTVRSRRWAENAVAVLAWPGKQWSVAKWERGGETMRPWIRASGGVATH